MKTKFIFLSLLYLCLNTNFLSAQTIRPVNNGPNATPTDYATLQDAHDAANAGDILMLHGSSTSYGNLTSTKQLTIIGPGYFLEDIPGIGPANSLTARTGNITLDVGSDGTLVKGIHISTIHANSNNTTIQGNYISNDVKIQSNTSNNYAATNTTIVNNYVSDDIFVSSDCINSVIKNNFIDIIYYGNNNSIEVFVFNNILLGASTINTVFSNNIFLTSSNPVSIASTQNNTFNNNIFTTTVLSSNGNVENVDLSTVFIGYPSNPDDYAYDERFQLLNNPSNPAIGGGENGIDCGMFGGNTPYVLSGLVDHPVIYELYVPYLNPSNANSMNVNVKVRSGN